MEQESFSNFAGNQISPAWVISQRGVCHCVEMKMWAWQWAPEALLGDPRTHICFHFATSQQPRASDSLWFALIVIPHYAVKCAMSGQKILSKMKSLKQRKRQCMREHERSKSSKYFTPPFLLAFSLQLESTVLQLKNVEIFA